MPHLQLSKNKVLMVRKMEIYYKDFNKHFWRLVDEVENEHCFLVKHSHLDPQMVMKWLFKLQ